MKKAKFPKFEMIKNRQQHSLKIERRDGKLEIQGISKWYSLWQDPYHLMLIIPWWAFAAIVAGSYILINTFFALLYIAGGDCLEGAKQGDFGDAFFFSVQTLASIGYGAIHPKNTYSNLIVTLEAIASLLIIAVVTGLAYARFSHPKAKIMFSRVMVITAHNGIPTLMFRLANQRRNYILEARLNAYLLADELTKEEEVIRRIYDLKLIRQKTPSLSLTWTAMHPINQDSPLWEMTPQLLAKKNAQIVVSVNGLDETIADHLHARYVYGNHEIIFNHRFVDVIKFMENGSRYIDYSHFHQVEPTKFTNNTYQKRDTV